MRLPPTELTDAERSLQLEVGTYLDERLPKGSYELGLGMSSGVDPEFSKDLGSKGWIGMSLPPEFGGHGRSAVERLVVVEALLGRGAPVGYHWVADRQSGPNIAANGTTEQKKKYLPGIARGELSFSIGMSEANSGSDLASVRTRAEPVEGGWRVNGTKIWTSWAQDATQILSLFRTSEDRHGGLTQFIVDRDTPGVTVNPIPFIDGTKDFCEVVYEDAFIPDEQRLGEVGAGWGQNTGELALERGGVDRWMTAMPILEHWVAERIREAGPVAQDQLGSIVARCWAFRGMSLSIARLVDQGYSPVNEAALVKEMATRFEQECVRTVSQWLGRPPNQDAEDPYERLLATACLVAPSWTIRGGTNEILRNVISKGLARK